MTHRSESIRENALSRISFREVAVDLFGSLVPGLVFTLTTVLTTSLALFSGFQFYLSTKAGAGSEYLTYNLLRHINDVEPLLNGLRFELTLLLLMFSYVVGHTFYRQDPKEADRRSFERLFPHARTRSSLAHQAKGQVTEWIRWLLRRKPPTIDEGPELRDWVAHSREECQFPYPRMREYLERRGLKHLTGLVTWSPPLDPRDGNGPAPVVQRTKNFINILKMRLNYHYPERVGHIARNEAHVRLMTSTWYMARVLLLPVGIAASTCIVVVALSVRAGVQESSPELFSALLLPAILCVGVFVACLITTRSIERFLHYQRVREVVWVLETAYTAFRSAPDLLADICPEFVEKVSTIRSQS